MANVTDEIPSCRPVNAPSVWLFRRFDTLSLNEGHGDACGRWSGYVMRSFGHQNRQSIAQNPGENEQC